MKPHFREFLNGSSHHPSRRGLCSHASQGRESLKTTPLGHGQPYAPVSDVDQGSSTSTSAFAVGLRSGMSCRQRRENRSVSPISSPLSSQESQRVSSAFKRIGKMGSLCSVKSRRTSASPIALQCIIYVSGRFTRFTEHLRRCLQLSTGERRATARELVDNPWLAI